MGVFDGGKGIEKEVLDAKTAEAGTEADNEEIQGYRIRGISDLDSKERKAYAECIKANYADKDGTIGHVNCKPGDYSMKGRMKALESMNDGYPLSYKSDEWESKTAKKERKAAEKAEKKKKKAEEKAAKKKAKEEKKAAKKAAKEAKKKAKAEAKAAKKAAKEAAKKAKADKAGTESGGQEAADDSAEAGGD